MLYKQRIWRFKIAAVVLSVLATLLVLEIFFRIFGPEYHRFNRFSSVYYSNPRGYHDVLGTIDGHTVYGLSYNVSPELFRLPDDPEAAKTGHHHPECKILALGDSFTWGRGVRWKDLYTTRLQALLQKNGLSFCINNAGVIAADIEHINKIHSYLTKKQHYDLVIYGFVLNDFGLPSFYKNYGQDFIDQNNGGYNYKWWRKASALANFICHRMEQKRLAQVTTKAYLQAFSGPAAQKKWKILEQINQRAKRQGGKLMIVLFPLLYDFDHYPFTPIHEKMAAFCKKHKIPLLDLLPAYSKYKDRDLWVHPIDHHPNEIAHRLAAQEIFRFLKEHPDILNTNS